MFGELVCWYSLLVKNVEENERRICWRTQHIHCTASLCAMLVKKTRLKSAAYCLQPQRSQCLPHSIYLTTHCSVTKLCLTLCDPHGLLPARPLYSPLSSRVCSNSCPLSQWCHPTISSSATPSFCLQSFPASGSFPVSHLFTLGAQVLELQLQHQFFQWIFSVDFL